jgi:hypothetical protein
MYCEKFQSKSIAFGSRKIRTWSMVSLSPTILSADHRSTRHHGSIINSIVVQFNNPEEFRCILKLHVNSIVPKRQIKFRCIQNQNFFTFVRQGKRGYETEVEIGILFHLHPEFDRSSLFYASSRIHNQNRHNTIQNTINSEDFKLVRK